MTDSDPPDPSIGDLIGTPDEQGPPSRRGEDLRREIDQQRRKHTELLEEGKFDAGADMDRPDLVLIHHGNLGDHEAMMRRIGDGASLHTYRDLADAEQKLPRHIAGCDFVIVTENASGLDQFEEYQDRLFVIVDENDADPGRSDVPRIVRPIDSASKPGRQRKPSSSLSRAAILTKVAIASSAVGGLPIV